MRRGLVAAISLAALVLASAATAWLLRPAPAELLLGLVALAGLAYRPIAGTVSRLVPVAADPERDYRPLQRAAHALSSSLDGQVLVGALQVGLREAFHQPDLAVYLRQPDEDSTLRLAAATGLAELPGILPDGTVARALSGDTAVVEAGGLHQMLIGATMNLAEEQALRRPGVALWGALRGVDGALLGLVLLGSDGWLEPYSPADRAAIGQLLDTAALAFANSFAYQRQRSAEATIRALYHALQQVQDETSAALAREIHDEIINISVRLNIRALERLIPLAVDPALRQELEQLLASEQTVSQSLRMVCERLHPTGLDDPGGLPGVLRGQLARVQTFWDGACALEIAGTALPIAPDIQRHIFRIAREALTNAVKHAEATQITVTLRYPDGPEDWVSLAITDNGASGQVATARPGHWGMRNMQESAAAAGGRLRVQQRATGGTEVAVCFPPAPVGRSEELAWARGEPWHSRGNENHEPIEQSRG